MLVDVEALELFLRGDPEPDRVLQHQEEGSGGDGDEREHRNDTDELRHELVGSIAIEQTAVDGEQSDRQGAPCAAHAMHRDSTDRVVDLDPVEEQHGEHDDDAGDAADDDRAPVAHVRATGGDPNEAGEDAVAGHGDVGLPAQEPDRDHGRDGACGRGEHRGDRDRRDDDVGGEL